MRKLAFLFGAYCLLGKARRVSRSPRHLTAKLAVLPAVFFAVADCFLVVLGAVIVATNESLATFFGAFMDVFLPNWHLSPRRKPFVLLIRSLH
jgi:hypothetical protein